MQIVLFLIGGLALFLFGLNIAGKSLAIVSGGGLRRLVLAFTRNRFTSASIGFAMAILLQSSSAMSVLVVGLAESGVLHLRSAIPLLLGANVGATVTVQLIAFNLTDMALLFIAAGFFTRSLAKEGIANAIGEVVLGFGLVFYGMKVMGLAGGFIAENPALSSFVANLEGHPWIAVLIATALTAILQASAATIGLAISLSAGGLLSTESTLFIVAGANIGTVATAIITSYQTGYKGKRVAAAHIFMRIVGAVIFIAFIPFFHRAAALGDASSARTIANANTLFSVALFLIAIPFVYQVRMLVRRWVPRSMHPPKPVIDAKYLDDTFIDYPAIALDQAWKEIHRINKYLNEMMADLKPLMMESEFSRVQSVEKKEKYIDSLVRQTVSYLVRVSQGKVPDYLSQKLVEQLSILDNLESISDTLKRMAAQSAKRIESNITFSEEGAKELAEIHNLTTSLLQRLSISLRDESHRGLKKLLLQAQKIEQKEEKLKLSHFRRLMSGAPESEASTAIHMELLNLYTRVISRIRIIASMPQEAVALEELDFEFDDIIE